MKRYFLLSSVWVLLFVSCAALRSIDMTKVSLGMNKEQVSSSLKKKPFRMVGAKQYSNGSMEIAEYVSPISNGIYDTYWLYFWNNKLVKYEVPSKGKDQKYNPWQDEMDKAYYSLQLDKVQVLGKVSN